jgi:hypothetical protein
VLLMGDFAQIPPVLSTSLMAGMPLVERSGDSGRCLALAGRQTFNDFQDVVRLRRTHRQKGVCPFKESTMRLRDSALSLDDYNLWKTHEVDDVDPVAACPWPGSDQLLEEALFLVPENGPVGSMEGVWLHGRRFIVSQALPALLASLSGVKLGITEEAASTEKKKTFETCGKPCISVSGRA